MKTITHILGLILLISATAVAQLAPVNEPQVCFNCHADMETMTKEKHVHTAFEGGACSDCHNPHASSHMGLLSSTPGELCVSCHEDISAAAAGAHGHAPAAAGDCMSCHDPHASSHGDQLTKEMKALCLECHATTMQKWETAEKTHAPVAGGACMNCHDAHGTEHDGMVDRGVPGLCIDCHTMDAGFRAAHSGWDMTNAD